MMFMSSSPRKIIAVLCGTAAMVTAAGCAKDNDVAVSGVAAGRHHVEAGELIDLLAGVVALGCQVGDRRHDVDRRRMAGDEDAAIDPLSIPEVRAAVQRASFELLVGFQLTQEQLEYNVRR